MNKRPLNQNYYQITTKGLTLPSDNRFPLPPREEVELCKAFIKKQIGRWERPNVKFNNCRLANAVEALGGETVSDGAFIQAMLDLGYRMYECWWNASAVIFDADYRRLEKYCRDRGIDIPV